MWDKMTSCPTTRRATPTKRNCGKIPAVKIPRRKFWCQVAALTLLPLCAWRDGHAQEQSPLAPGPANSSVSIVSPPDVVQGSLDELRGKQRALLLVKRSLVLDAKDLGRSIIEEAYQADRRGNNTNRFVFGTIGRKLNEYIRKHKSMSAVERATDADFIIFFNLLEHRRMLYSYYPYGEMFVILNQPQGSNLAPRIVWKTDRVLWAEDAAKKFIKELKRVRGER